MSQTPAPPTLADKHSGIPQGLLLKAQRAKGLAYQNRTKTVAPRKKPPALPPGISATAFATAINSLIDTLGGSNVELNDQPFDDGWYMERGSRVLFPMTTAMLTFHFRPKYT